MLPTAPPDCSASPPLLERRGETDAAARAGTHGSTSSSSSPSLYTSPICTR